MAEEGKEKLIATGYTSDEEEEENHVGKQVRSYFGIPLIMCSAFFYSLSSLTVKLMADVDPMELLMFRFLGLAMFTFPITVYYKAPLFPRDIKDNIFLLYHSGVASAVGIFSFYAFRHMPLGDASSLCFSTPLFVVIITFVFMRENCCDFTFFIVSMTFVGIVLVSKPESLFGTSVNDSVESWGVISAITSAFCRANSFISLKFCKHLHFSVIICHFGLVGLTFSLIYMVVTHNFCIPSSFFDRFLLIGMSLLGFLGQLFLTTASKTETPATMSICRSTDILFSFLYQTFIFHQTPDAYSIVGAILIVTSVGLVKMKPKEEK